MPRFEFEFRTFPWFYAITVVLCGELCLLFSWCVSYRCNMVGGGEDCCRSRRPGAKNQGWSSRGRVLGDRMIGRSGDVVCDLHRAHQGDECGLLG
jgi:hypothetical protein